MFFGLGALAAVVFFFGNRGKSKTSSEEETLMREVDSNNTVIGERSFENNPNMVTDVLRNDLGYEGIIVTDALSMGAITQKHDSAQASVMALDAGVDMLLMPQDFKQAAQGILKAVKRGEISEERVDDSLRRIIKAKLLWKR